MKKLNGKSWFLLILAGILLIVAIASMILAPSAWILGVILIIFIAVLVFIALKPLRQLSDKNAYTVEGTFLSIGKYGDGWVGCYFEIDGKETRVAIMEDVYKPKLLMPGGKYRLTCNKKNNDVLRVERVD